MKYRYVTKHIPIDEAIEHYAKVTGKTHRQARSAILQALKSGEVKAMGVRRDNGLIEDIPTEVWEEVPSEH